MARHDHAMNATKDPEVFEADARGGHMDSSKAFELFLGVRIIRTMLLDHSSPWRLRRRLPAGKPAPE